MSYPVLELRRVLLAADGRLKGQFSDNSILLVNQSGSAFMCLSPDGITTTRQLSEYALNKQSPQLAVLLEFRNMHVDIPFFCRPLLRCTQGAFSLGYRIAEVWWPRDVAEAKELELLQTLADGRLALCSEDHTARVVLHVHRRRFAVCYPLLVQADQASGKHEYLWHNQAFSLQSYPPRWQPAVQLLLEEASSSESVSNSKDAVSEPHAISHQHEPCQRDIHETGGSSARSSSNRQPPAAQQDQHPTERESSGAAPHHATAHPPQQQQPRQQCTLSDCNAFISHEHPPHNHTSDHSQPSHSPHPSHQQPHGHTHTSQRQPHNHTTERGNGGSAPQHDSNCNTARVLSFAQPCSELPTALGRDLCGVCDRFPDPSWWFEPTLSLLPPDDVITLEWTPQATYQFHPERQEVEVWVHADESCLSSCKHGRYVLHCRGTAAPDRLYEASCVPELVWSRDRDERYALGQLAAHALKMR
ncbi:MAG: hypothetical protein WDW38_001541 [Sanguina aurantia]